MKNCKNIENNLPLYAEGLLSDAEKKMVKEHLTECADCSKALANLQKVTAMTQRLPEVEPPPWFKQKIMARVRKQTEKKNFAQKWFYPLRIKIPVQVMATIVIAVLAVYIYRSGDDQMKAVLPEAQQPVMEAQQEPSPAEMPKAKKAAPALLAEGKTAVIGEVKKDQMSAEVSSGESAPKMEIQEAPQKHAARQESMKDRSAEDYSLSGAAKKSKLFKAAAPAASGQMAASVTDQVQPVISIYVADVNSAVVEAEKILTKHNARKVTKKLVAGKAILQAELPAKQLKNLLSQLLGIGRVEEKNMPADGGDQDIKVIIEIKTIQ